MALDDLLFSLLEPVGATGDTHVVGWDTVGQWPEGALKQFLKIGILTPTARARSIECHGCENRCFKGVIIDQGTEGRPARAFILCDDPEMQSQMGRITVPMEHLQQWRVTLLQIAKVVARLMGIESKAEDRAGAANIRIGMVKTDSGRRWLSLNKSPLTLELNNHRAPLEELLFFDGDSLSIDRERIERLINTLPHQVEKPYTPSTEKRETRKRSTAAMYEDWRQEYIKLRRHYPDTVRHTDSWIARKIASMQIAQGRDAETIRKKMKQ